MGLSLSSSETAICAMLCVRNVFYDREILLGAPPIGSHRASCGPRTAPGSTVSRASGPKSQPAADSAAHSSWRQAEICLGKIGSCGICRPGEQGGEATSKSLGPPPAVIEHTLTQPLVCQAQC